jgi:hypothetical protein
MREGQGSAQEVQSLGRGIARKEMTATATAARSYPRRSTATDAAAAAAEVITTESARVLTEDIITAPATFLFKKYAFATIQRHLNKREKYQNRNVKLERKQDVVFIHTTENGRKNLVSSPSVEAVSQINTSVAPLRKSSAGKHQGQELSTLVRGAQGRVRKPLGCLTAEATIVGGGGGIPEPIKAPSLPLPRTPAREAVGSFLALGTPRKPQNSSPKSDPFLIVCWTVFGFQNGLQNKTKSCREVS